MPGAGGCPQPERSLSSSVMYYCSFCCQCFRDACRLYLWALPKTEVSVFPFRFPSSSIFRTSFNILFPNQTSVCRCLCVTQSVAVMCQLYVTCRYGK